MAGKIRPPAIAAILSLVSACKVSPTKSATAATLRSEIRRPYQRAGPNSHTRGTWASSNNAIAANDATRRVRPPLWAAFSKPELVARSLHVLELRLCILPLLAPATCEQCPTLSTDRSKDDGEER